VGKNGLSLTVLFVGVLIISRNFFITYKYFFKIHNYTLHIRITSNTNNIKSNKKIINFHKREMCETIKKEFLILSPPRR
jgi:hypothetical protein